jgi:hypothetical protein
MRKYIVIISNKNISAGKKAIIESNRFDPFMFSFENIAKTNITKLRIIFIFNPENSEYLYTPKALFSSRFIFSLESCIAPLFRPKALKRIKKLKMFKA